MELCVGGGGEGSPPNLKTPLSIRVWLLTLLFHELVICMEGIRGLSTD